MASAFLIILIALIVSKSLFPGPHPTIYAFPIYQIFYSNICFYLYFSAGHSLYSNIYEYSNPLFLPHSIVLDVREMHPSFSLLPSQAS